MRFGLFGTGHWAREVHARALASHPEVEFVGVWGRDPAKSADLAGQFGVIAFAEVDELLKEVDAVAFAVPPQVQAELALRAARAGRHLLLDKPLALTVAAAEAVVAEVQAERLASVVFFTNRFQPTTIEALHRVAETGGWLGGQSTFFGSIYTEGSPYADSVWRHEHGGLWDVGPHALSLLVPVLGAVTSVHATFGPRQTAYVTLTHETDAVSTMALSLNAAVKTSKVETLLHGEDGWLALPAFDGDATGSLRRAIDELLAAVPLGEHPLDVRFGRDVVKVLAAAEESATAGSSVALP